MFKHINILAAAALTLGAIFANAPAAHAHEIKIGKIVIHHPWIRQPVKGAPAAAGFTKIDNTGTEDDVLLKATVESFPTVQIHEMKMEGDVMKMAELKNGLPLPAGKTVELKPKSFHIMLMGLKNPLMEGEIMKGTLTFAKAGTVAVDFEVMPAAGEAHLHN